MTNRQKRNDINGRHDTTVFNANQADLQTTVVIEWLSIQQPANRSRRGINNNSQIRHKLQHFINSLRQKNVRQTFFYKKIVLRRRGNNRHCSNVHVLLHCIRNSIRLTDGKNTTEKKIPLRACGRQARERKRYASNLNEHKHVFCRANVVGHAQLTKWRGVNFR